MVSHWKELVDSGKKLAQLVLATRTPQNFATPYLRIPPGLELDDKECAYKVDLQETIEFSSFQNKNNVTSGKTC